MGISLSRFADLIRNFVDGKPAQILLLGLNSAGKTTILYKMVYNASVHTTATVGFNVESVTACDGLTLSLWDVGGQSKIRPLWQYYYKKTDGLVFVVDSADTERLQEAKEELSSILSDRRMKGVPFVVVANKQDLPNAKKPEELIEDLELRTVSKAGGHKWRIHSACGVTGDGICQALQSMSTLTREFRKQRKG